MIAKMSVAFEPRNGKQAHEVRATIIDPLAKFEDVEMPACTG